MPSKVMAKVLSDSEKTGVDDSLVEIMSAIEYWNYLQSQFYVVRSGVTSTEQNDDEFQKACEVIHKKLYYLELRSWRHFLLVSGLSKSRVALEGRLRAYNRFLAEDMSIMEYLTPKGEIPGGYFGKTEEAFRKNLNNEIKEVKAQLTKLKRGERRRAGKR